MKNGLVIDSNGNKYWYKEDKCHREDGPAIEFINGHKYWYKEGKPHREDGPAIEWNNGPVIEYADGYKAWYYKGKKIKCSSTEEFIKLLKLKVFW